LATTDLIGALERAETAQLPQLARDAMRRLELALADRSVNDVLAHEAGSYVRVTPDVARAVTVYEVASERYAELVAMDARKMTGADFDSLATAQDRMNEARARLAAAGQLHLIEVAR
jgi:hypothetical protein